MTELMRVRARWSGFTGGPGYTVLHFRDFGSGDGGGGPVTAASAAAAIERTNTFFTAIRALLPNVVRINVEGEVDVLEDTNGELVRSFGSTPPAVIVGTGGTTYSGPTGAVVNWRTGGIRNGRRIRGRSFLVPLSTSVLGSDGGIGTAAVTTIQTAASALAAPEGSPDLGVYARPSGPGAEDGTFSLVTAAQVPNLAAVLRSRRD